MAHLFILLIYQPFLNILVLFYWLLSLIPHYKPDMGIAVIFLTIVIRVLLLPLSLASDRSEDERQKISQRAKQIQKDYSTDPVRLNEELKKLFKTNPRIVVSEIVEFAINVLITLLLIRIFATGIEGADLHFLYPWMPHVPQPYNLIFLGRFDLGRPNLFLNIIQSLVILVVEIVAEYTSPFHNLLSIQHKHVETNFITRTKDDYVAETRNRVRSLQVIFPTVSFFIFLFLPAGKKLFIITTLLFTLLLMIVKAIHRKFMQLFPKPEEPVAVEAKSVAVSVPENSVHATKT